MKAVDIGRIGKMYVNGRKGDLLMGTLILADFGTDRRQCYLDHYTKCVAYHAFYHSYFDWDVKSCEPSLFPE